MGWIIIGELNILLRNKQNLYVISSFYSPMVLDKKVAEEIAKAITEAKFNKALKLITPLLKKDPNNVAFLLDYGFVSTNVQHFDEAIQSYEKVIELIPNSASGYAGLGFAYRIQGKNGKAIEAFVQGISKAQDNAMIHFELGETFFDMDQYENALKAYYKAIQFGGSENEAEILHRIAQVYLGMQEPDKAMDVAKTVLAKNAEYQSIYNIMGVAAYMKEEWDSATKFFEKYLKYVPDDEAALNILEEIKGKLK
jgi:tetratricopeptide (TPR) repeat protein